MSDISSASDLMTHPHHILVTDENGEKPSNLVFLLKLAGFAVSEFNNELEACNWLLQNDQAPHPASLLLLNQAKPDRMLLALLCQMRQRFKRLEIMLVTPEAQLLQGLIADIDPPVYQCTEEEAPNLARQILRQAHRPDPRPD
jgi:DNA-binding NtrC family response regulator